MAKFTQQIIFLTRKNLKIRFSRKCLSFCELFIPLLLTATIGLLVSNESRGHRGSSHSSTSISDSSEEDTNDDDSPEARFTCSSSSHSVYSYYWDDQYKCETLFGVINGAENMELVNRLNIQYVAGDKVDNNLLKQVMRSILKVAPKSNFHSSTSDNFTTNWISSRKSEKQLEICIMQLHEECKKIYAAVIFTNIQDEVEHNNRFTIRYKIRLTDDKDNNGEYFTDRLFADYIYGDFKRVVDGVKRIYMESDSIFVRGPGFVDIQAFIDRGITEYINTKYGNGRAEKVKVSLVRIPYVQPPNDRTADFSKFISLLYSLLTSLTIFSLMQVNSEKYSGFKELLRMHGITTWTQWMGWLFSSFLVYSVWTLLLALLFCLPIAGGPNLMPLAGINCVLYWLLLLLFTMAITSFCYLVSVFFERVWTAASIGLVTWIMLIVFMMVASAAFTSLRTWTAIGLMLVPTVAFDFTFRLFLNGGGTFGTMGVPVIENVSLTCLHCLAMLLLDSCIFMTLTMYLDNILPSKYGVKRPPFYFIRDLRKFLRKITAKDARANYEYKCDDDESVEMTSIISQDSQQPFESDPEHLEAAVIIRNLRKVFKRNKKRAVDGLNAKMFNGEIYALLGFNGAGKTTTIGVLTGLTAPTEGMARIFDLDIRKDMEEIRKHIGLCPQHNLLFNEMTVLELVAFFGTLKGLKDPYTKARELLTWLGMSDKLNDRPEKLSGGQKRRVHLAIALIGDTKLAFLDEPTSGLDPETRRGVWDILLKLRGKMTIILTTHTMEEADVLGDRIGIMSEGKMMCSGTPSYLKKYYGVGYNLKMSASNSQCDPEKVYSFSKRYIPNARLNNLGPSTGGSHDSISISLPTADLDMSQVADLMDGLRDQQDILGVENVGLSLSTMDEVFLKVGEAVHAVGVTVPTSGDTPNTNFSSSRYVESRLDWYRYTSLLYKRMLYFCSAPFTLIFLMLFFSAILWFSLTSFSYAVNSSTKADPPRVVSSSSLSSYHFPVVLLHERESANNRIMTSAPNNRNISYTVAYLSQLHRNSEKYDPIKIEDFPENTTFQDMMTSLKRESIRDLHYYRQHYLVGASFDNSSIPPDVTGFYSAYALHSAPLSLNLITQTLIKQKLSIDATIGVVNHPFKKAETYQHITPEAVRGGHRLFYFLTCGETILLVVITSLLTGTAALLPTEERLNKGKQLQLMTGTTPFIYWISMFSWDFLFFSFLNAIITIIFILSDSSTGNWIYTNNGAGFMIYFILECHSFAALWFCYLVSWAPCIKTSSDSFIIINKLALIVGVLWNVVRHLLIGITYYDIRRPGEMNVGLFTKFVYHSSHLSGYVAWVVPMYSLFQAMMKLTSKSIENSICNWFPQEVLDLSCDQAGVHDRIEHLFIHSCCPDCKVACFEPESYLNISSTTSTMSFGLESYYGHSLVYDILLLLLSGIASAGILFALEYLLPETRAKRQIAKLSCASPEGASILASSRALDEDVVNEAARVEDIVKDNALETANHALVTHNLHLKFGELKAVKGLSFGVHRGECFGLLGVNGAGKTSTFRMITGDTFPSTGNMYSGGLNFYKHRAAYLSSLGYCPQFDGIIGSLTGLQMVKLYGALRGIPPARLQEDATVWLDKFGLLGSASKKCANYSGGMKRRLSAAMALIGNPKLLLLDEPTTGVDPAFRRQFWNVIREIRESGQSVVLTSHTMDECEQLCTRLGIMVDGQFKCLGNIQHLKNKFGKGYILTLKLQRVAEENEQENDTRIKLLFEKIVEKCSPCRLQTQQKTFIQYQIMNKSLWYSDIFRTMEQIRNLPELSQLVEEYSVTETSLEDVFISFASQKQHTGQ